MELEKKHNEEFENYVFRMIENRKYNNLEHDELYEILFNEEISITEARKRLYGVKTYISIKKENETSDGVIDISKKPRLVISDLHLPFAIDGWLDFMKETHSKFNCHDEIIINGDLLDFHAVSFHSKETDSDTLNEEFDKAYMMMQELIKAFPNIIWLEGNHDIRIARQNKEVGIHERFIKTFHQLFDLPDTVKIMEEVIIDNVFYRHIGCVGGKDGAINSAVSNRMSTVVSHLHSNGGAKYITSPNMEMIFGLNTGCLFDESTYAGRYGKLSRFKGTLGCGVVYSDKEAYFIPKMK